MDTKKTFSELLESDNSLTEEFRNVATKMFQEAVESRVESRVSEQVGIIRECVVQQSAEIIEETVNALVEERCKALEESMKEQVAEAGNRILTEQIEQHKREVSEMLAKKSEQIIKEELEQQRQTIAEVGSQIIEEQVKTIKGEYEAEYAKLVEKLVEAEEKVKELESKDCEVDALVDEGAELFEKMADALDKYASEVADQFLEMHKLELCEVEKVRCAEEFFKDLTEVYSKYCINIKESCKSKPRSDKKLEEAYTRLSEQIEQNGELSHRIEELERQLAFKDLTKDLTKVESVRVAKLAENYRGDIDSYKKRVEYLVESVASKPTAHEFGKFNVVSDKSVLLEESAKKKAPSEDADVATVLKYMQSYQNNK